MSAAEEDPAPEAEEEVEVCLVIGILFRGYSLIGRKGLL